MAAIRMTRREAQEANRAAVLGAARELFEELGYHRATVDAIAARAGFSKGAVYSRFDSKDDLFLAVLEENIARRHADMREQLAAADVVAIERLAEASVAESAQSLAWQAALIEFRVHAWRHPEINARYVELHRTTVANLTELFEVAHARGAMANVPQREYLLHALAATNGLMLELMADPTLDVLAIAERQALVTGWDGAEER